MQKSKHKLQSKQKFHHKNKNQTIDTNYETIESQDVYEMKNIHYQDFQLSPEVMIDEDQDVKKKHNDSVHLEIELDDGKVEIIKPSPDDDPLVLAKNFCRLNQLDQSMIPILAKNIEKTIEKLIKTKTNQYHKNNQKQQLPNNKSVKSNRVHTEPSMMIYGTNQHMSSNEILTNEKPITNHFQSISKQFSKKKILLQNKHENYNSSSTFNIKVNPLEVNHRNSKSTFVKKPKFKSIKKQTQDDSIRTQKFLKTQPNQPFRNNTSNRLQQNKENEVRQSIYDCSNSNERKKVTKQFYKVQGLIRNNFIYESKPVKNQHQRSVVDRSFQQRKNQNNNESKDSQKRKCFVKSIENSDDKQPSLKNHRQSPQVNYSLVNLSTNTRHPNQSYHRKQVSNSIIYNSSSSNHIQQTHRLYENQKQKAFKSIFSLLDDDEDGAISIMNINLVDKIEQRLIQVLFPVLEEMEILQTELNQQEFIQAMEKLFVKLTVQQKAYLLKYFNKQQQEHSKQNNNNLNQVLFSSIQPKMSPISLQLVNQTQRRNVTVYEYSKIREQQKNKKLQQQRVEKERSMMRNCTFQPKVNSKKIIYF